MKKILIFIAALFVFVGSVKAENVTLVKDVYDNTYVYYYDRSMGKTRYLHASKYLFGNIPAYCIELGKDIASFDYTMTNSFNGINISKEDLEYIKLLSYYGYNYPGHDTDRYYMATQGLIWKRLAKTSIKFTIGFNPDTFYNLTDEETAINVLVNRHNIRPSFDNANVDVIKGNETVLEDENEVLYLYYSDDDNVVIDGNKLIINKYFDTYPGVRDYMDKEIETAKKNGYVKTIMNRKRVIDELKSTNYMIRNMGERMALNTPVQGSASDILKKAMIEIDEIFEKENIKSKMLLQVHDELIFNVYDDEIDKVKEIVYNTMTNVFDLKVPLDVDIELGNNWYEAK